MQFYIAEEGEPISVHDNEAVITYMGSQIELKYRPEVTYEDNIYSVKLPLLGKIFPCWIYGQNLLFLDAYYLLAESVKPETWEPITSVLYDIHTGRYASLHHRYDDVIIKKNFVELSNSFTHQCFVLSNPNTLHWEDI